MVVMSSSDGHLPSVMGTRLHHQPINVGQIEITAYLWSFTGSDILLLCVMLSFAT
jgi:hypothetical protein